MKRYTIILITLLMLSSISALEITSKDTFSKGETFIGTLGGNILEPIPRENFKFFRGNTQIPLTSDVIKIYNTYYIYAVLPPTPQNYTLKVEDVYFKEFGQTKTQTIEKKFTIDEQTAEFSVSPAVFYTDKNLSISITNNLNQDLTITTNLESEEQTFTAPLQDTTTETITTSHINSTTFTTMTVNSESGFGYEIPVYIYRTEQNESSQCNNETAPYCYGDLCESNIEDFCLYGVESIGQTELVNPDSEDCYYLVESIECKSANTSIANKTKTLEFSSNYLDVQLKKGDTFVHKLLLKNTGNKTEKITLHLSDEIKNYLTLSTSNEELAPNNQTEITLTAQFNEIGNFSGKILAQSDNAYGEILIDFIIDTNISTNISTGGTQTKQSCAQLGGLKCEYDCYGGNWQIASDGLCCVGGTCEANEPKKRNWVAIGIVVFLLALIGFFILMRLKRPPKSKDILKKRSENFSTRFRTNNSLER